MLQNVIAIIWILYTHTWINIYRKVNHRPEVTCDHTGIMLHNTCIALHNQTNVILQRSICLQPISWLSFVHLSCHRYTAVYKKRVHCAWWSKQYSVNNAALSHLRRFPWWYVHKTLATWAHFVIFCPYISCKIFPYIHNDNAWMAHVKIQYAPYKMARVLSCIVLVYLLISQLVALK